MKNKNIIEVSNSLGDQYSKRKTQNNKKEIGQFFTPIHIAEYMAQLCTIDKKVISILDPGCGCMILSSALIYHLTNQSQNEIKEIKLELYESDINLELDINKVLNELTIYLQDREIKFSYNIYFQDFVLENACYLYEESMRKFDVIISNPPYFKVAKNSAHSTKTEIINSGQPNIYAMFMAISSRLLDIKGQFIFIVPRSFASGLYFKKFRKYFLNYLNIEKIHLFENRSDTFKKDQVLQEVLIIKGSPLNSITIEVTSSDNSIKNLETKVYPYNKIVDLDNEHSYIFIPTNKKECRILDIVSSWTNRLSDFDLSISTGPVVDFRSKEDIMLYVEGQSNYVPYIRMNNVNEMSLIWPDKSLKKEQLINITPKIKSVLRKNLNYILLRRQSAKGDKKRLIATPYDSSEYKCEYLGIDNKINYIYSKNRSLSKEEIYGLSAILNSDFMNTYFQILNGNTNVSASEIRELKFPDFEFILEVGRKILNKEFVNFSQLNSFVDKVLKK